MCSEEIHGEAEEIVHEKTNARLLAKREPSGLHKLTEHQNNCKICEVTRKDV
jgi:hypothetical protein